MQAAAAVWDPSQAHGLDQSGSKQLYEEPKELYEEPGQLYEERGGNVKPEEQL